MRAKGLTARDARGLRPEASDRHPRVFFHSFKNDENDDERSAL